MARVSWFKEHRTWEDWVGIGLGVLIGLSPWITAQRVDHGVLFIAVALGLAVMMLAQLELIGINRWLAVAELGCGLALIALPFIAGYAASGVLRFWHFGLGALVTLLALLEVWQDWSLSDADLAKRRR